MTLSTTSSSPRNRRVVLLFVALVALAVALAAGLFSNDRDAAATTTHDGHGSSAAAPVQNAGHAAFQDAMRKLWEDHVTWTRLAIVAFADGSAGFDATAARLMKNQEDIGDAVKPYFGDAAGDRLTTLLKGHIGTAVELLQAARSGDQAAFDKANADWYANSDQIADFLAAANPKYWPRATMRAAMKAHLDQTLAEASHELGKQYAASVADYDAIHDHILMMADVLSSGIIKAFPARFH